MKARAKVRPASAPAVTDYRLQEQIGFLLRRAHQAATEAFQTTMDGFDVTPRQFSVLITLLQRGETGFGRLGALTAMDPATLLGVAQRLSRRGLVALRSDPVDKRRRLARLTPEGEGLAADVIQRGPDVSERILTDFTTSERATLLTLVERLGSRDTPAT